MANFRDLALKYVLSEDEPAQRQIVETAAKEIERARANSTVVGNWAASVQQWISPASAGDDDGEDGEDGASGNILTRAKALSFLAGTLEALDRATLKTDQVLRLTGFFGAVFSYDHKAGITASAKALRQLYAMKNFRPDMAAKIIEDVCKLKEDFRLQTASTRLEIYELILSLVEDSSVSSELQYHYGQSCGFVVDLLQLCQAERDPKNLMIWFKILAVTLADYPQSPEVTEQIFKAFSAYFPISLRSSATPTAVTPDDLKGAVRSCFAAHQRLAPLAFPFLIQKLDQGDAITVAVKVDILKTIEACITQYEHPQNSVVPHMDKIWNSLKYEVRNGEVKETIDATLHVLSAIANKLNGSEPSGLKSYIDLVFKDCRDDLGSPNYTKQAGLLLVTVISANVRAYTLENANLVGCIRQNLAQSKSPSHTKDLVLLLNSALKERQKLIKTRKTEDEEQLKNETLTHLSSLFHEVYLPIWTKNISSPDTGQVDVLRQVVQGLDALVSQQVLRADGQVMLLCSRTTCSDICKLLTRILTKGLALSSNDNAATDSALEDDCVVALRNIVVNYGDGFPELMSGVRAEIRRRDWVTSSQYSLDALKDLVSRLAFIGCSEIPSNNALDVPSTRPYSPLQHFITLVAASLDLFPLAVAHDESVKEPLANSYLISVIHGAMLYFRDACAARHKPETLSARSSSDNNWLQEFEALPGDWLQQLDSADEATDEKLYSLTGDEPEVYRQFLRLSLFTVRSLYQRAASGTQPPWSDRILGQLANIAGLVVRSLDEKLQSLCNLAHEAFNHFSAQTISPNKPHSELLTFGILEGLWPGAMVDLYKPGGIAETLLCDASDIGPPRAAIGAILANKHKGGPSTPDPESQTIKKVLEFWGNQIMEATTSTTTANPEAFTALNDIAMHVFAGAIARQDKNVANLVVPVIHEAIASEHANGEIVARSAGTLVRVGSSELLSSENHGVVRRLYKQWIYNILVKSLYQDALPAADQDPARSGRHATAILSIVSECPFKVYEEDLEPLSRLLITALNRPARGSAGSSSGLQTAASALQVLHEILANEPTTLEGHLEAVINGAVAVCGECSPKNKVSSSKGMVQCRKLALQLLGALPQKFEERHLLSSSRKLQRMLALACGDPVRELRAVARQARANWEKVV